MCTGAAWLTFLYAKLMKEMVAVPIICAAGWWPGNGLRCHRRHCDRSVWEGCRVSCRPNNNNKLQRKQVMKYDPTSVKKAAYRSRSTGPLIVWWIRQAIMESVSCQSIIQSRRRIKVLWSSRGVLLLREAASRLGYSGPWASTIRSGHMG